jgi:hypothetical protein
MQYMLLLYNDDAPIDGDEQDILRRYGAFTQEVRDNGTFVEGNRLQPASTSTTIRIRDGETLVTDGPFAETKEQLGGYYVLECENIDEALAYAAKIPAAEYGSIEVRPVWQM